MTMPFRNLWAFGICLGALGAGCRHVPDERARQGAQIHYDLGIQAQQAGDNQQAYREFDLASEMDPTLPEAQNALGVLLHLVFHKPEEAIQHYQKALDARADFSEARVNLANVYLSEEHYDQAIALYEQSLNDMLYPTPYIAQNNLGWAQFKKGQTQLGIDNIKSAVVANPKFCQGFRNLALIAESQKLTHEACKQWGKFGDACPDVGEPAYRRAMCLLRDGDADGARKAFADCAAKVKEGTVKDDCKSQLEQLSGATHPSR